MAQKVWYSNYSHLREQVRALKLEFSENCKRLGIAEITAMQDYSNMIIAQAVHESNWQEGIELEKGKTKKFAKMAFDEFEDMAMSAIDMNKLMKLHQKFVAKLFKGGAKEEEVGAYNLAMAHKAASWIYIDVLMKNLVWARKQLVDLAEAEISSGGVLSEERKEIYEDFVHKISEEKMSTHPMLFPAAGDFKTMGDYYRFLFDFETGALEYPFKSINLHFLHKIIMMGIYPSGGSGKFRRVNVHVSNAEILFPAPDAVPALMDHFCNCINCDSAEEERILRVAKISHRFVEIHPYEDGNGRLSRVLMNMLLFPEYPPVYLKADRKGRGRYAFALRKADRGNYHPLASLICMSIIEIYGKINRSLCKKDF